MANKYSAGSPTTRARFRPESAISRYAPVKKGSIYLLVCDVTIEGDVEVAGEVSSRASGGLKRIRAKNEGPLPRHAEIMLVPLERVI